MNVVKVLNERIEQEGLPVAQLAQKVNMKSELLRRSLKGTRELKAREFVAICKTLNLEVSDFAC